MGLEQGEGHHYGFGAGPSSWVWGRGDKVPRVKPLGGVVEAGTFA